jgi:hypothetical protein
MIQIYEKLKTLPMEAKKLSSQNMRCTVNKVLQPLSLTMTFPLHPFFYQYFPLSLSVIDENYFLQFSEHPD